MQDVTNSVSLPSLYCTLEVSILLDSCNTCSHFKRILHPSPAQHFKTFKEFLIYFPHCSRFSTTQSYAPNAA